MASRLPRLLGVLDAHHPGGGLREALERCLLDHTCRNAGFELGLGDLRQALEEDQYAPMAEQLRKTQDQLAELITLDPDRLEAQLYHAASEAVLGLSAPHAPTRVHTVASALRDTLHFYRDYRTPHPHPHPGLGTTTPERRDRLVGTHCGARRGCRTSRPR